MIDDHENCSPASVCAVVVAYYPDAGLKARLEELLPQVDRLVVVDNTPEGQREQQLEQLLAESERIHFIQNTTNLGVAAALNQSLSQALDWGCVWLLTLDQDSHCYPDMVQTLLSVKEACVPSTAVIGGNYLDKRNNKVKVPVGKPDEFLDRKTVITSGCLVDARFAKAIGGYREDYFIDQLDHEFCLRARSHGGRIVISRKPVMDHSVGDTGGAWLPLLGHLPNHPPLRKYYIARNSLVTIAEYWRSEPDWCLRRLARLLLGAVSMLLLEKNGAAKIRAFSHGVADAMRGRMGPCQRVSLLDK